MGIVKMTKGLQNPIRGGDQSAQNDRSENADGHRHDGVVARAETHLLFCEEAQENIERAVREILINVGEDPSRDGLKDTPQRVAKAYQELLDGYTKDVESVVNGALFDVPYGENEMVVVKDIEFHS